jgi:hypothetical protein
MTVISLSEFTGHGSGSRRSWPISDFLEQTEHLSHSGKPDILLALASAMWLGSIVRLSQENPGLIAGLHRNAVLNNESSKEFRQTLIYC